MQQRIFWLDAARAIAIMLVVFTHVNGQISNDYVLKSLFNSIDRLGVPIFIMLSGGLLLPKLSQVDFLQFYKKRIPQFIILIIFYSIVTSAFFLYFFKGQGFIESIFIALKNHNGVYPANTGIQASHLWFMYMIIELYLIAPFLSRLVACLTDKEILYFIILCVFFVQLKDSIGTKLDTSFISRMGRDFLGSYLSYFLFGYLVIHRKLSLSKIYQYMLFIIPIIVCVSVELYSKSYIARFHWYSNSIFVVVSGFGLILILKDIFHTVKEIKLFTLLSKLSFGIYLIHIVILYAIRRIGNDVLADMGLAGKLSFLFITTMFFSCVITWLLSKNKYTKYLVQ